MFQRFYKGFKGNADNFASMYQFSVCLSAYFWVFVCLFVSMHVNLHVCCLFVCVCNPAGVLYCPPIFRLIHHHSDVLCIILTGVSLHINKQKLDNLTDARLIHDHFHQILSF